MSTTSGSWVSLSGGPTIPDVYVGTSRRVLVFVSAQMTIGNAYALASVEVSGASTITDSPGAPATVGGFDTGDPSANGRVFAASTATSVLMFDASDGLNSGLNTFEVKYRRQLSSGFTPITAASFYRRRIVVLPF